MTDEPRVCVTEHRTNPERQRRAAEGSVLCRGCIEHARRNLEELPARYEELAGALKPGKSHAQRVSGTPEKQLPIVPGVADHRGQIRSVLVSWALMVAEERGLYGPQTAAVPVVAAWLGEHHDWSVQQPWADSYAFEIGELAQRAWNLLYPSGARRFEVGRCQEVYPDEQGGLTRCDGTVIAVIRDTDSLLPSELVCEGCGHSIPADEWLRYGRKIKQEAA